MKSLKYITVVTFVLIGGTVSFGYWSLNEFSYALNNLSALSISSVLLVSTPFGEKNDELISTSTSTTASTSTSTSTPTLISPQLQTPKDLELFFTFPQKGDKIYIGCTYEILWQSSTTVDSIETSLVDAYTHKPAGPIASGVSKENMIHPDSQNLKWNVGVVWPGEYYIAVSKINNADINRKSEVFTINKMPKGIDAREQKNICEKTGGLF